jgi:hypothetical protein
VWYFTLQCWIYYFAFKFTEIGNWQFVNHLWPFFVCRSSLIVVISHLITSSLFVPNNLICGCLDYGSWGGVSMLFEKSLHLKVCSMIGNSATGYVQVPYASPLCIFMEFPTSLRAISLLWKLIFCGVLYVYAIHVEIFPFVAMTEPSFVFNIFTLIILFVIY